MPAHLETDRRDKTVKVGSVFREGCTAETGLPHISVRCNIQVYKDIGKYYLYTVAVLKKEKVLYYKRQKQKKQKLDCFMAILNLQDLSDVSFSSIAKNRHSYYLIYTLFLN